MNADDPADVPCEVHFFGVDPANGQLLRPPKCWKEVRQCVVETFRLEKNPAQVRKARRRAESRGEDRVRRGRPPAGVDPKDLASAGWGILFADGVEPAVKEALAPLIEHRRQQVGSERRCRVFDGNKALPRGCTPADWLAHLGLSPGIGDVDRVPYYLMVVADPEHVPFGFEFDLAASSYAPGRLHFRRPEDYARYAENVIAAESAPRPRPPRLTFVGMEHPGDLTRSSMRHLVKPLCERFAGADGWQVDAFLGEQATKPCLASLLGGGETPSILFTAGHGLGPGPDGDDGRLGALLCAPFPGKNWPGGPLTEDLYFAAGDLDDGADLRGLVAILFGCFTAGMPAFDSFCFSPPRPLGRASMAALAGRMLSHPRGALAVLGHVDRAWSFSYCWRKTPTPQAFVSVLQALLDGEPIGGAAAYLNLRHNAVQNELLRLAEKVLKCEPYDVDRFVVDWMTERDARAYLVYGDPATRPLPR